MDELALRLQGTGVEDGQLTFTGVHKITGALQLLATRIGRTLIGQKGLADHHLRSRTNAIQASVPQTLLVIDTDAFSHAYVRGAGA